MAAALHRSKHHHLAASVCLLARGKLRKQVCLELVLPKRIRQQYLELAIPAEECQVVYLAACQVETKLVASQLMRPHHPCAVCLQQIEVSQVHLDRELAHNLLVWLAALQRMDHPVAFPL